MPRRVIKTTSWHHGFYAAMQLECRQWRNDLEFYSEVPLGSEPNIMDMLVIKKNRDVKITNLIGMNFKETNILEFKSPPDELSIDDFFKALSYACEYKSHGESVNERRCSRMTLTIFREKTPHKMFSDLREDGAVIEKAHRGVYIVKGISPFFTQVICYGEMTDEDGLVWLRTLTNDLTSRAFERLAEEYDTATDAEYKRNLSALVYIAVRQNAESYGYALNEEDIMLQMEDLKKLFKSEFAAVAAEAREEGLAEGEAKGRAEGEARGIISMGRKFNLPESGILEQLVIMLKCTLPEAEAMLRAQPV